MIQCILELVLMEGKYIVQEINLYDLMRYYAKKLAQPAGCAYRCHHRRGLYGYHTDATL